MRMYGKTAILLILSLLLMGCVDAPTASAAEPYSVLIGADPEEMGEQPVYRTVVVDGAYFSKEDIDTLHRQGGRVYSCLYLTEYALADRKALRSEIEACCGDKRYIVYIASSIELDGTKFY